jgi:hypothetical protein
MAANTMGDDAGGPRRKLKTLFHMNQYSARQNGAWSGSKDSL